MKTKKVHLNLLTSEIPQISTFQNPNLLFSNAHKIKFLNIFTKNVTNLIQTQSKKSDLKFHPKNHNIFACAEKRDGLKIYDIETTKLINEYQFETNLIQFNNDGLVCAVNDEFLCLFDLRFKFPCKQKRIFDVKKIEFFDENYLLVKNYDGIFGIDFERMKKEVEWEESGILDFKVCGDLFFTKKNKFGMVKNGIKTEISCCGTVMSLINNSLVNGSLINDDSGVVYDSNTVNNDIIVDGSAMNNGNVIVVGGKNELEYGFVKSRNKMVFGNVGWVDNVFGGNGRLIVCSDTGIYVGFTSFFE